jgi:hypothetical protein
MSSTPLRIAIREEGGSVNAYLAPTGSMQGAVLVSSLPANVARLPGVWPAWQEFWRTASAAIVRDVLPDAKVLDVQFTTAPEHEKAGHA